MRIYISGKNGFIGSNLFKKLSLNNDVINEEFNLNEIYKIKQFLPDIIIHCAARVGSTNCRNNLEDTINSNILGIYKIAAVSKEINSYFVYLSSIDVYNFSNTFNVIDEKSSICPQTIYGMSKLFGEEVCKEMIDDLLIIRLGYIYGHPSNDPYSFISSIFNEKVVSLIGNYYKDYVYIDDCIEAICMLINLKVKGIVNIGSGEGHLIKEILDFVGISSFKFDLNDYTKNFVIKTDYINQLTEWKPKINFWEKLDEFRKEYYKK